MLFLSDAEIDALAIHKVGNKNREEDLLISDELLNIRDLELKDAVAKYFFSSMKEDLFFTFHHETDIALNEVFYYSKEIFKNPDSLLEHSANLAKLLYERSVHPNVKSGELYVGYFKKCQVNEEEVDAIGLFKSESRHSFLKVLQNNNKIDLAHEKGIDISRLDKGCLIYKTNEENGYILSVVDNTNKRSEAKYWMDEFLQVKENEDNHYTTRNFMNLCKDFITLDLPDKFEVSKPDQMDLLSKSANYLKENESLDFNTYAESVMEQGEVIERFNSFKDQYQDEKGVNLYNNFEISPSTVKKQSRIFKSILKLDKNFHIYIHGNRNMIEQGEDENGRKFYKIYYEKES
ncbi:MAG: nucleoid-associated protein [Chitinophagaceae bacterium]|nr:MAG: nucleoid-associated protein [Chitinophagaceae bacterium]